MEELRASPAGPGGERSREDTAGAQDGTSCEQEVGVLKLEGGRRCDGQMSCGVFHVGVTALGRVMWGVDCGCGFGVTCQRLCGVGRGVAAVS